MGSVFGTFNQYINNINTFLLSIRSPYHRDDLAIYIPNTEPIFIQQILLKLWFGIRDFFKSH